MQTDIETLWELLLNAEWQGMRKLSTLAGAIGKSEEHTRGLLAGMGCHVFTWPTGADMVRLPAPIGDAMAQTFADYGAEYLEPVGFSLAAWPHN